MEARSLILALWAFPGWIVALLMLPFLGPTGYFWHKGVLWVSVSRLVPSFATAQCWGLITFTRAPEPSQRLLAHEDRHSTQWGWFGPLFLPLYGLASCWSRFQDGNWYLDNAFEADARAYAYQEEIKASPQH